MYSTKYRKLQTKYRKLHKEVFPTAWALSPHPLGIISPSLGHILIKRLLTFPDFSRHFFTL